MPAVPLEDLRPVGIAIPREENGAVVFDLYEREVRVAGDVPFLRAVLGLCDGSRGLAEIAAELDTDVADVRELIAGLAEHEIVVDCIEAWRRFHRDSGVQSLLYRPVDEELLLELQSWSFRPDHPGGRSVPLSPLRTRVMELAARRHSAFATEPPRSVSFEELSALLEAMYDARGTRPVPSGGALYPVVVHVAVFEPIEGLDSGLWWYDPREGKLDLVRADVSDVRPLFLPYPTTDAVLDRAHPVVFLSADLRRSMRKYSNRAYRLALFEIGAVMQNAYLVGAETGLPLRAIAGFDDRAAERVLELPDGAVPLLTLLLGS